MTAAKLMMFDIDTLLANQTTQTLSDGCQLKVTSEGDISLSRSFYSTVSLYFCVANGQLFLSLNYVELLAQLRTQNIQLVPAPLYMCAYIAYQSVHTADTLYQSIYLLRPGEQCILQKHSNYQRTSEKSIFFHDTSRTHSLTSDEMIGTLKTCLQQLTPNKTVFHLSSGLDSTALAILAADVFGNQPVRLATCITRGDGCINEVSNARRLAEDLGAEICVYDFTHIDVFEVGAEFIRGCLGYPVAHPSHLVEYLLDREIVAQGADTIVNGKGPDDCLAGYLWHLDAFANNLAHKQRVQVTDKDRLAELVKEGNSFNLTADFWRSNEPELSLSTRLAYDVRATTEAWNIIHSSIATHLNVDIISPFTSKLLREGMYSLKDEQKISNGWQKVFLRQTFTHLYPDYIANFSKKGFRLDLKPYFADHDRQELFAKIIVNEARANDYFNLNEVQSMIDETLSGGRNFGWQLWSIFCLMVAL